MGGRKDGQVEGMMDGRKDGWAEGRTEGKDRRRDRRAGEQAGGRMRGCMAVAWDRRLSISCVLLSSSNPKSSCTLRACVRVFVDAPRRHPHAAHTHACTRAHACKHTRKHASVAGAAWSGLSARTMDATPERPTRRIFL